MRRPAAVAGSLLFLLIAPGTVAVLVPRLISGWRMQAPLLHISALRVVGILLVAGGVPMLLDSFIRFALQGLGTPPPVFPTKHLVVTGFHRYVRNPMYVGVLWVILGQGLLLGDTRVFGYGLMVWVGFHLFVIAYEEPKLHHPFGTQYELFVASVPRWIPRLSPWR